MKRDFEEGEKNLSQKNTLCGGNHCGKCCGGSCSGCGSLELTQAEADFLLTFAELPFQPVVGKDVSDCHVYAFPACMSEESPKPDVRPEVISALAGKGLIEADYDIPLRNYDYQGFEDYPLHGSMALTIRGQQVLDQLYSLGFESSADVKGDRP